MRLLRIIIPVIIGVGATAVMFCCEFDPDSLSDIRLGWWNVLSILLAMILMTCRDFGLSWRFRLMCRPQHLSWGQAYRENLLCEFSSATTPSSVGGSGLIALYLKAFGIPAGKGIAVTISTIFLDELFFILACPIFLMVFSYEELFGSTHEVLYVFAPVYFLIVIWTIALYIALFKKPDFVSAVLLRIFSIRLLRRWRGDIEKLESDLNVSAAIMKHQSASFWAKALIATSLAWISRFMVACALFIPYIPLGAQPLVFARQLVLWIVMMVSPTPGGSGICEFVFSTYYSNMVNNPNVTLLITCIWRIITYYVYLMAGLCILPDWVKRYKRRPA